MEQLLEDYRAYYKLRADRYAGDAVYNNSYLSEKALYDCICNVQSLDELMQTKATEFRELSLQNGKALLTDQSKYALDFYIAEKEKIKAIPHQQIIENITAGKDAMQLTAIVNELLVKNDTAVLLDEMWPMHFFNDAVNWLENLEMLSTAAVPENWKADMRQQETETKKLFLEISAAFLAGIKNYDPNWKWDYELLWEYRHRKKCPLPDAVLHKRIGQHRSLLV